MEFLTRSIQRTADIAAGYKVGTLVIDAGEAYLQLDTGELLLATGTVEIRNGDTWQRLTADDIAATTAEGWPLFAGLDARMMI